MESSHLLPHPPQTQTLSSRTFSPPPLDGSLSLPELWEWHSTNSPHHRLFVFSRDNGELKTIFWPEAVRAIHTGARSVRKVMKWQSGMKDVPVVAILAASDTITFFTMLSSIIRAGYIAFPISPRNSPAAVAHLISKVTVKHVFVGREQSLVDLKNEAFDILRTQYLTDSVPSFSEVPLFEDFFTASPPEPDDIPYERRGPDDVLVYLHSSGSTAFPKPIAWTSLRCIQIALIPFFGDRDLTDVVFSLHTMPMYHGIGVFHLCWAPSCGLVISAFEPRSPAHIPTTESHFEAAVATSCDIILAVPSIIEAWSRKPEYAKWLAKRGGVLFGGGPLNKASGDYLASQGVSVFTLYGSTEGGIISPYLPAEVGYDWEYFRFPGNVTAEMVPYGKNTYELVMVANPFCRPSVINTKVNGVDAYATSDLLIEHPQKPGFWRVYGRTDDQIMHSTGEKTNPGPLENILNQDPHIQSSVMFGRGEFQAGVLIDPKEEYKFDPSDEILLAEFRNKIWPTVQRLNAFAPQHSRLFKEMIIVCKPSKPFQYTAKSTPRRQVIINDYAEEIKALYTAVEDSTQSNIPPPSEWDSLSILTFVRAVVNNVLSHSVKDDEDIFQHGADSLQATWIRNSLLRALRDSAQIDTRNLVDNFVYDHPTISSISSFIATIAAGVTYDSAINMSSRVAAMRSMVEKYTTEPFPAPSTISSNGSAKAQGDVVFLTGSTGALGCYLLAELVENPKVSKIYAVNRSRLSKSLPLRERQAKALLERGLESDVLESPKFYLLEGDLTVPGFGLPAEVVAEMKSSVTHIIHNAWPVDFNLSLASFEASIKGLRNLIDFALTSSLPFPPTFIYTSSIGVFQNVKSNDIDSPLFEAPIEPEVAVGTGYTESKWVSEDILIQASKLTKLNSIIVRVGQLAGGLNGAWNTAEWFPALVQSAQVCGCLPTEEKPVDWIPLPLAAKAVVDFRLAGTPASSTVVHLIHPRPAPWSSLAKIIAQDLSIPIVQFSEWLAKLEQFGKGSTNGHAEVEDLRRIPALRLIQFFRAMASKVGSSPIAFGFPLLACDASIRSSATLSGSDIYELGEKDVKKWLEYWRSVGFLQG